MFRRAYLAPLLAAALFSGPALAQTAAPKPAAASTAAKPLGKPALWVVKDADTTIYLFGTMHLYDGQKDWFRGKVREAFDKSSQVVFEIDPNSASDQAKMMPFVQKYGMRAPDSKPTRELPGIDKAGLEREGQSFGLPTQALDRMQPWLVAITFTALGAQKIGLNPEQGAERTIVKAANEAKKGIGELESAEGQLTMLANLPEKQQVEFVNATVQDLAKMQELFGKMAASWQDGHPDDLAKLLNDSMDQYPELRKTILTDRNARWAKAIEERLKTPGVTLIAVGAGHLAGKDSVQDFLKKDGVQITRLQ
jgi:uncharacterized protein YbaP (TraB family)